jgi:aspartate-semialdehyde dehydrogenase
VTVETHSPLPVDRARDLLTGAPGVVVLDDPANGVYPLALEASGTDDVYVGRLRQDPSLEDERGLIMWIVSDNLRKGAATNAIQICEALVERDLVRVPADARAVAA